MPGSVFGSLRSARVRQPLLSSPGADGTRTICRILVAACPAVFWSVPLPQILTHTLPISPPLAALVDVAVLRTVAVTVFGVFLMMGIGALARRQRWLTPSADETLLTLFIRLFLPALIFQQVVGKASLRSAENVLAPPVTAFLVVCIGFTVAFVALWGLSRVRNAPRSLGLPPARRTFILCVGVFNYGYVTIPLVASLFPPGADDGTLGTLFIFNVGVEAALWGVGVTILHGGFTTGWWKRLLSPPILATILAISLNMTAWQPSTWPEPLPSIMEALTLAMNYLAAAAIPVGLLLTGATIRDDWSQARLRSDPGTIALSSVLRLLLLPAIFVLIAVFLPLSLELKRVLVLQAAMPAAVFPIVLSRHYGGDVGLALRIVVGTTLLSLITMPIWIAVGLALLE